MASIRELILQHVVADLDAAGKPSGSTVHRQRTLPIEDDTLPAYVVYLHTEQATPGDGRHGYKVRRTTRVFVECRALVGAGTAPDAALDPLTSWAVQAVMADRTQGDLALHTNEVGTEWRASDTDAVRAAATIAFDIEHHTDAADPDAL